MREGMNDMIERRKDLARRAVFDAVLTRRDLARDAGLSYAALRAWATGRRTPEINSLARLAVALERRAERLNAIATEIRSVL